MKNSNFQNQLVYGLLQSCFAYQGNNTDFARFNIGLMAKFKGFIVDNFFLFLKKLGFVRAHFEWDHVRHHLDAHIPHLGELEKVHNLLNDEYSKKLFIELILFRILGSHHVKLMLNNKSYWEKYHRGNNNYLKKKQTSYTGRFYLNHYEIDGISGPINLHVGSLTAFTLEQYAYRQKDKVISVEPGDIVIDGGACWGDTTLYFADKVGANGKVYSFEFVEDNVEILLNNINLNQHLKDRIEVMPNALWNISGETLEFSSNRGPSTWIGIVDSQNDTLRVSSIAIDNLVYEKGISKVDFIKMDVEGSELNALMGAKKTIQQFKPRLAISIYHKNEDLFEIPLYINSLALGYEFYIDHFTIHREETVLFADIKS